MNVQFGADIYFWVDIEFGVDVQLQYKITCTSQGM